MISRQYLFSGDHSKGPRGNLLGYDLPIENGESCRPVNHDNLRGIRTIMKGKHVHYDEISTKIGSDVVMSFDVVKAIFHTHTKRCIHAYVQIHTRKIITTMTHEYAICTTLTHKQTQT